MSGPDDLEVARKARLFSGRLDAATPEDALTDPEVAEALRVASFIRVKAGADLSRDARDRIAAELFPRRTGFGRIGFAVAAGVGFVALLGTLMLTTTLKHEVMGSPSSQSSSSSRAAHQLVAELLPGTATDRASNALNDALSGYRSHLAGEGVPQ